MGIIPLGTDALHGSLSTIWMHLDWVDHVYNPFAGERFKNRLWIRPHQIEVTKKKDD